MAPTALAQALPAAPPPDASPARAAWWAQPGDWRTQALIVYMLQIAYLLFESLRTDHALHFAGPLDWLAFKVDEITRQGVHVIAAVAALQCIDRLRAPRPQRTPTAVLAMLGAAGVSAAASSFGVPYEPAAVRVGASASVAVWFGYTWWMNTMVGLLALAAIDGLRGRQQALVHLSRVQAQGRLVRQQRASAQLLAIQARVDPRLVFEMLGAVKRFYEHDPARAEQLLDELTAFLRAALPRLRSARSTLDVEFGLVQGCVRLLQCSDTVSVELAQELPAELASAAFPPGVLLPLLGVATAAPARRIRLEATAQDTMLRVQVDDSAWPAAATLDRLRAWLGDLYGDRAALRAAALGDGVRIELELPLERD
jgi:type IV secretory pathway VirB3-like protein